MSKNTNYQLPGNQKYLYYCKTKRLATQIDWYKLFIKKKNISVEVLVACLDEFAEKYCQHYKPKGTNIPHWAWDNYKGHVIDSAQFSFQELLKIITHHTGVTFKYRKRKSKQYSYEDWWNEKNLDGSFAYNGVTDDF